PSASEHISGRHGYTILVIHDDARPTY
ncbi:MAG: hypothetical protein QOE51_2745, partial [Actinoplanes sp.]|nr:hypothetical protein [Actinoplanes sp.]